MIELNSYLNAAQESINFWNEDDVEIFLKLISDQVDNSVVDWEVGDEEWGRVVLDTQPIALVCAKVPFVLFLESYRIIFQILEFQYLWGLIALKVKFFALMSIF